MPLAAACALTIAAVFALTAAPALLGSYSFDLEHATATLLLASGLIALATCDVLTGLLPDRLNIALAGCGLCVAALEGGALLQHVAGAALGYAILAGLARAYLVVRRQHGLGMGDAKLLAASGAWLGVAALPTVLVWAAGAGLVTVTLAALRQGRIDAGSRIPFGPFLAMATWIVWLYGPIGGGWP